MDLKKEIKQLWHRGNEKPLNGRLIVMLNNSNKIIGRYNSKADTVEYWYAPGKCLNPKFTPRCYWAYMSQLRGNDVFEYGYDGDWKSKKKIPFGKEGRV